MSIVPKPIVLIFVGYYLPGYKAGGILRSVVNLVSHLHREFHFKIVTRDHDLGDDTPYPEIKQMEWHTVGNASVYYLRSQHESLANLRSIVRNTPHDLIYLTSFFEPFTIKVLLNIKLGRADHKPIVLTPFGEFAWASLSLKYSKKALFIWSAKRFKLYAPVIWRASSTLEAEDITKVMRIALESVHIIPDLPTIETNDIAADQTVRVGDELHIVFISRISPEKNLDFALKILRQVRSKITFDIIGPIENIEYWKECEKLIGLLPTHVAARFIGSIRPSEVIRTFAEYDLFLFPSGGEAFGHVIAEALTAGTPILISTNTPWRNLETKGLGWDFPLDDIAPFVRVIEELSKSSARDKLDRRQIVKKNMKQLQAESSAVIENQQFFFFALGLAKREKPSP